ncbi:ATP-grasp domain-containing protein [Shouchella lehensis]|uniref:ATP-grasp domain-containing protein n=1 Tax=Shouchella lehensis G1 TaxID=1246626 RepID=A0A060LP82_9BACI|nr:ATP-grasp domain-containing protein [Shouchella lehensis]AIC93106.1 hypothetical protein BleG1_0498 [Shouchella lehensis G1]
MKKIIFIESNTTGTGMIALKKTKELGYDPILIAKNLKIYNGFSELDCKSMTINTDNLNDIISCLKNIKKDNIAGVFTTSDYYLETVAQVNHSLNFIGNSLESIHTCRDKGIFRNRLKQFDIQQPNFLIVEKQESLHCIKNKISYPCVVKPTDESGSNRVKFCINFEEVEALTREIFAEPYNKRGQRRNQKVLIEEYIDGDEYSVEMFTWEGNPKCIGITKKCVTGFPHFVEKQHIFPAPISSDIYSKIELTVMNALKAVNFRYGASHAEVKWTEKGCFTIEINARLAGGMIPELVKYSSGIDLIEKQLLCVTNTPPSFKEIKYHDYMGINFFTANESGKISSITGVDDVLSIPDVLEFNLKVKVGEKVKMPKNFSDRLGYVIVKGNTYKELLIRLKDVSEKVIISIN